MQITILKIGGGADINLPGIAADLKKFEGPVVVVHGANTVRDDLARRLGTPTRTITSASGVSSVLTDENALDVLTMAYGGLVNKRFVSLCQQNGVNAIGLTGLDGGLVRGRRNPGIRVEENGRKRLVHDLSGKPVEINTALIELLLANGYTPVITVPILDENGYAVNTENDSVVALLQSRLMATRVIQLMEAPGLLRDPDDPGSLVPSLSFADLASLEKVAEGRFRRKLMALATMAATGCRVILMADGRAEHPLPLALAGAGTTIQ